MDPLDFLKAEKLLQFLRQRKNQISRMENPQTFLRLLRDYDLLPEDSYKEEERPVMKRKKTLCSDEEEQPGPSSQLNPGQRKKPENITISSPLKKGERSQLPVTCGDKKGTLYRDRMAKGQKCIWSQKQWFTAPEFETFAGKTTSKNWKLSIRCNNTPLGKLIQEGHLPSARFRRGRKKAKKSSFPSDHEITDEEEEAEEQAEQQSEDHQDRNKTVFKVTRGAAAGSGTCGKSIRTETKWMTPVEFVNEASSQTDVCWKKDIEREGEPLGVLIEEEERPVTKRKKTVCSDEEEQPGPSSQLNPGQRKKPKNITISSPLKKGERSQLPVTCGDKKGTLYRDRMAKGQKCIWSQKQWFTPPEFETFAGKTTSKNWKLSIRCNNTPLGKLIQEGHLPSARFKQGRKKAKKSSFPSDHEITDEEEEAEEQAEQQSEDHQDRNKTVFKVTRGAAAGSDEEEEAEEQAEQQSEDHQDKNKTVFNVTRGAAAGSGTCGKSIRTETKWMTPVEFVNEASSQTDVCWKKDIKWEGKPLSVLIEKNRENDDECYICKCGEEAAELVLCDHCPRSFHQKCHLPHVDDADLRDDRPWMCTFCAFRNTQEPDMTTVLSYPISQHMLECQYLLLYLFHADAEQAFALNPTLYLEHYSTVVQTPMWLGKVAKKLQKNEYGTVGEFVFDVQLIFTNWATYHHDNAVFRSLGDQLKELFDGEFKKVFNICEPTLG